MADLIWQPIIVNVYYPIILCNHSQKKLKRTEANSRLTLIVRRIVKCGRPKKHTDNVTAVSQLAVALGTWTGETSQGFQEQKKKFDILLKYNT